ncbi:SDR family oxidoreductase [Microbacterium sp. 22242]|uniref:SDR family oxidoreductase n=1 Tax=Microbacterium sp. 22242 TaxID=3453896 RepID=UPI003F8754F3
MRIAVAGGTGRIGRLVVREIERRGHEAVSLSRGEGADLRTREGLADALRGADAVIDVTNPSVATVAEAEETFAAITGNLLAAERSAGVGHHVALSITALDAVDGNPHYFGKREQERAIRAGGGPYSILRATQFHDFPGMIADWATEDGESLVPPLLLQPIAPLDVAVALVEIALAAPQNGTSEIAGPRTEIAGPRTEDAVDMARRTFAARGDDRRIRAAWRGSAMSVEFAGEVLLPGEGARLALTSFDDWLASGAA